MEDLYNNYCSTVTLFLQSTFNVSHQRLLAFKKTLIKKYHHMCLRFCICFFFYFWKVFFSLWRTCHSVESTNDIHNRCDVTSSDKTSDYEWDFKSCLDLSQGWSVFKNACWRYSRSATYYSSSVVVISITLEQAYASGDFFLFGLFSRHVAMRSKSGNETKRVREAVHVRWKNIIGNCNKSCEIFETWKILRITILICGLRPTSTYFIPFSPRLHSF